MNEIVKTAKARIVTSGYSDRFLLTDVTFWFGDAQFDSRDKLINFLMNTIGKSFDDAWDMSHVPTTVMRIVGYINTRTFIHARIESWEFDELSLFLLNNHRDVDELRFSKNLSDVIKYQLSECDRENIAHWGYWNGLEGLWKNRKKLEQEGE